MALAWWIGRRPWPDVCPLKRISNGVVAAVILSCTGAMIVLSEVDNLFRTILPVPQMLVEIFNNMRGGEEHVLAGGFLMVVVAPVTEELIFRGLILKGFLQRFSVLKAAILSSILFGLVHLNPWQFVSGSLLGLLFAWWYARTGSLWPSLLGHAFVNGSFWLFALLPFEIQGFNSSEYSASPQFQPLWFDVLGVSLLSLGGWLFHRQVPRGTPLHSSAQTPPALPPRLEPTPPALPGEKN
jgi:membrane protease YdiL (CAAX protease family)